MAAVANQIHSTTQQVGARIARNPTDAATQPATGARERLLRAHLVAPTDFDANPQTEPFVETKLCSTPQLDIGER